MTVSVEKNNENDKLILDMFRTDPEVAFRLLFDAYYYRLCVYSVHLTDSFYMAEDIVQSVFIYLWEKKLYLNINQNLRYYLYCSVRNASLAALQRKNMVSVEELSGIDMSIPEEATDEEEREEQRKIIVEKLEKLSVQERMAIKVVILENKKYKEAAKEMNISVNTLKTYLARALKRLRKEFNLNLLFY